MKTINLKFITAALLSAGIFFACSNPNENAADEAKEKAEEAQEDARASDIENERANYKADILSRIARNEQRITELEQKQQETGKTMDKILQDRIDALRKRNAELKEKINNYNESDKAKWEEFKREFNHDMDELGKSLDDLNEDNVK